MIPETRARKIAETMVHVLKNTVWPVALSLAEHEGLEPFGPLNARAGRGKRTYHRIDVNMDTGDMSHLIVFGKNMVLSKFSERRANDWLTAHEIQDKGYFGGKATLEHLLAHTILHESAHAIQNMAGDRVKGAVHNAQFYRWLDHLSDLAGHACLTDLRERCKQKALSLTFDQTLDPPDQMVAKDDVTPGDAYEATLRSGKTVTVTIQKVNSKTVTGKDEGGMFYRLLFSDLRKKTQRPISVVSSQPQRSRTRTVQLSGGDITGPITEFIGSTFFLSCDFYCPIHYHATQFYSGKHLYYWLLSTRIRDTSVRNRIARTYSLEALDAILREYRLEFEALPEDLKIRALKRTIWQKFQNPALKQRLLETGDRSLEPTDKEVHPALGRQLMALRAHLNESSMRAAG